MSPTAPPCTGQVHCEVPASLIAQWQVYEANVQSYRALAATVQSFFLAVGSIVASTSQGDLITLAIMLCLTGVGVVHLWWIWFLPIRARCLIVDYFKFQVERHFTAERAQALQAFCGPNDYVHDAAKRARVNAEFFGMPRLEVFRPTRRKLDITVPWLYGLIWALLLALSLERTDWSNLPYLPGPG